HPSCSLCSSSSLLLSAAWATSPLYTLSLHDALPICPAVTGPAAAVFWPASPAAWSATAVAIAAATTTAAVPPASRHNRSRPREADRKSTRLNSSHLGISYAVFCLKKKTQELRRSSAT